MPLRIYTDEHVPTVIADELRRRNVNAQSARDVGNLGIDDSEQLEYAIRERAVLFTHDDDFLRLAVVWEQSGREHWGILFAPATRYTIGERIRRLLEYAVMLNPEEMRNKVEYL
ncbi:MAG: DUF5615 family PIN-like protein [Candidatus Poribacteria bacterium]|nr:DUF5615 family PIN-like protein [Candidatus Poribacteria bacterium]